MSLRNDRAPHGYLRFAHAACTPHADPWTFNREDRMPREPSNQFRDENPHQGASHSFGLPAAAQSQSRERERDIETRRERDGTLDRRRGDVSRPTYGALGTPFAAMRRLAEDMDRLFDDLAFGGRGSAPRLTRDATGLRSMWSPEVETFRRGDKLIVRADLPGLNKEDLKVDVDGNVLTIEGERSEESRDEDDGYYHTERSYGHFYRAIPLPDGVDATQCDATFKDGVLEVTLAAPKTPERTGRRIEIK
jgi:HSP20 family protein